MRIMIVDDSAAFRDATKLLLKKNPVYQIVAEAENGKEALEIFEEYEPELILMDIEMPILNGIEATKLMLKKNNSLKIIAVSGYQDTLYIKEILEAGFLAFVNKNKVFDQLQTAITHAYIGKLYFPAEFETEL